MYPQYKSPLGYTNGDNKIDAYGVDHSGFSTRDELEYQLARQNKENQLIQNYNNQGITKNYPQQGTNFWGTSPDNNYGFGTSKIHDNIENMMQNQTVQANGLETENQAKANNIPRYWDTAADGEKVWNYVQQQEGDVKSQSQNMINYLYSLGAGLGNMYGNYQNFTPIKMSDKYKHAVINCSASQYGEGGNDMAKLVSWGKEARDIWTGQNTEDSSKSDDYANKIGRLLGTKYPKGNCQVIVQKYIDK